MLRRKTRNEKHPVPMQPILRSINGRPCLTPCNPQKWAYLHPILLTPITDLFHSSCAIDPLHTDSKEYESSGSDIIFADKCNLEDNEKYRLPNELDSLLRSFQFNPRDFLNKVYEIYSFEDAIKWTLENQYLPFDTIKRVHNMSWKIFGSKLSELSDATLDYYYEIAKKWWLPDYLDIIFQDYSFELDGVKSSSTPGQEIRDLIVNQLFTYEFVIECIKKYINEYQDQWDNIESHYRNLKQFVLNELLELINSKTVLNKISS